jgi:hypothetical protein
MPAPEDISFKLERFGWASPDRLEVEGEWHGLRRRPARATLVVEVDGQRRRLKALPEPSKGSSEHWVAAFPWEGEMPRLPGAELEIGRGIVVDLPRPRRSKARGAATTPAEPIPATSREERDSAPGREEAERLLAVLSAARADADEAGARAASARAEATALRERAEAAEAELASTDVPALRTRADEAEAELDRAERELEAVQARAEAAETELEPLRGRAEETATQLEAMRERAEAAESKLEAMRERAQAAEGELTAAAGRLEKAEAKLEPLRARAEAAEEELTAHGAAAGVGPEVERLRLELQNVERERIELRAQLDTMAERLEAAEQEARTPSSSAPREAAAASANTSERTRAMPGPRTAAAGGARFDRAAAGPTDARETAPPRRTRRPAERTARRSGGTTEPAAAEPSGPPLGERLSDWVSSLTGSRPESQNGGVDAKPEKTRPPAGRTERARAAQASGAAARTRRRSASAHDGPSWPLRVVAIGLLALLMVALVVIVLSLF